MPMSGRLLNSSIRRTCNHRYLRFAPLGLDDNDCGRVLIATVGVSEFESTKFIWNLALAMKPDIVCRYGRSTGQVEDRAAKCDVRYPMYLDIL